MSFATRLKEARKNKQLTQKQLGELVGVGNTAISNYEKSVTFPNLDILYKIFDILQTEPNFFFQDEITDTGSSLEFDSNQLILDMYNKLDNEDKAEIRGEMRQMLKADKYSKSTPSDK